MEHRGKVVRWEVDEGWGIIESTAVDSPVWAHFSMIDQNSRGVREAHGFRKLEVGDDVKFTVERAEQDGCHWRAIWVCTA
ncbi:cold shock domain-containing protein [Amycolatopsis sp. NPDC004079]|uniref:cold-shock protein n=1 Tax=Amycolatopsis sp. NPDC004079 TaxID=3154549 RepID=UPI0033B39708